MLRYKITPIDSHGHQFEVEITIDAPSPQQQLQLPAWLPGSYMIRDFAKHISDLSAWSTAQPQQQLPLQLIDKQTWQLETRGEAVTISYRVYAWDLSVRTAYLDQFWGFFNHSALCLAVIGQTDQPCQVDLVLPARLAHWKIATGMPRIAGDVWRAGSFSAPNYDALIDYPMLLGELSIASFNVSNIPHHLVLVGKHYADMERITADLTKICQQQMALFGEQAPFTEYWFLTMVLGKGFGGLEHRNSTALMCSRKDLATTKTTPVEADYRVFLSLCSHEYFHSWNVKSLKPRAFLPYQLQQEQYTEQLWFYEGMTSYFDDYVLHQAGLIDAQSYLQCVGEAIARVERGLGQQRQTVTESSFLAWTKFYQQNENAPNAIVSYYAKGGLIGMCIDIMLRQAGSATTLGDVMQTLWQTYGVTDIGTDDDTVIQYFIDQQRDDIAAMLRRALYSTEPLPLTELLASVGVALQPVLPSDDNSYNGKPVKEALPVQLGAKYKGFPLGLELTHVFLNEAAHEAGLAAGDRIIAIDYLAVQDSNVKEVLSRFQPEQMTRIHAFRRDELFSVDLRWHAPVASSRQLKVVDKELAGRWLRFD